MWCVKEQSKATPMGKICSPIMETLDGAKTLQTLLQAQFEKDKKPEDDPKHYFVVQVISRRGKKANP